MSARLQSRPKRVSRPGDVPADAVTASASGLDPDISEAYAVLQAPRVAAARGMEIGDVMAMIKANTHGRTLGVLGSEHVNVIELNLDLVSTRSTDE